MYAWAKYYWRRAAEAKKRAAETADPARKSALEKAASDWLAHARRAEPLQRNHIAKKMG
jgi:hypothetical protein